MGFEDVNVPASSQTSSPMGIAFTEIPISEKKKAPKRILHFSDGVLEEYSTDEEDELDVPANTTTVADPKHMSWAPYLWYLALTMGSKTLAVCDYLGENLAHFFGITTPKYQYEIDEYQRMLQEEEEEREKADEEVKSGWVTTSLPSTSTSSLTGSYSVSTPVQNIKRIEVEPSSLSLNLSPPSATFPNSTPSTSKDWERF